MVHAANLGQQKARYPTSQCKLDFDEVALDKPAANLTSIEWWRKQVAKEIVHAQIQRSPRTSCSRGWYSRLPVCNVCYTWRHTFRLALGER